MAENVTAHTQWLLEHGVAGLGDDEALLQAILSVRNWRVEWVPPSRLRMLQAAPPPGCWSVCFGDVEAPYSTGEGDTLLEACIAAFRSAVRWDDIRHLRPEEVAFIQAVLAERDAP